MQIETNERRTLDLETERMTLQVCQADEHKPPRESSQTKADSLRSFNTLELCHWLYIRL